MADLRATREPASAELTATAVADLRRMSEFLASRSALSFRAEIQYDAVQESGQKIEFGSRREVAMVVPDRIRVEVTHWEGEREIVTFDGHRLFVTLPEQRVYASIEHVGTVGSAFDLLVDEHGVATPLADLLRHDLADEVESRALSARNLGVVTIAGTACDHLAFRGQRVDFQLYIRRGDEPVPMRFVIDYHGEEGAPQFRAMLRDWNLAPVLDDSLFRTSPSAGAQRVAFDELLDMLLGDPIDTLSRPAASPPGARP